MKARMTPLTCKEVDRATLDIKRKTVDFVPPWGASSTQFGPVENN